MKKKHPSPDEDLPFLTIEAVLDVGTATLGLHGDERYRCAEQKKKGRSKDGKRQLVTALFSDIPPGKDGREASRCRITVLKDGKDWTAVPQSGFFRYADAMTAQYLSLVSESLGCDLVRHITALKTATPPEAPPELLDRYGEPMQKLAEKLFPDNQRMRVAEIRTTGAVPVLRLEKTDGFTAAPFRPGQYVTVTPEQPQGAAPMPFLLCSSPVKAQEGYYLVAPAPTEPANGDANGTMLWQVGKTVNVSAPQGSFYRSPLLDHGTVIGFTDAAGAGAFLSMGFALRDGLDKFKLTVIYLEQTPGDLPFAEAFAALSGKINLLRVPADATDDLCHAGFLRKHLPHESYSVFVCGGGRLHKLARAALDRLRLPENAVRIDPMRFSGRQKAEIIR